MSCLDMTFAWASTSANSPVGFVMAHEPEGLGFESRRPQKSEMRKCCGAVLQNFVMLGYEMTNLSSFFASRAQRAEENLN